MADPRERIEKIFLEIQSRNSMLVFIRGMTELQSLFNQIGGCASDEIRMHIPEDTLYYTLDTNELSQHIKSLSIEGRQEFLLNCPFLNYPRPTTRTAASFGKISRDSIANSVMHYDIQFNHWDICDEQVDVQSIINNLNKDSAVTSAQWRDKWRDARVTTAIQLLVNTSIHNFELTDNEESQKKALISAINSALRLFKYKGIASTEPDLYFKCNESSPLIYGEAKCAFKAFPPDPLDKKRSSHYCLYGFGLAVARYSIFGIDSKNLRRNIQFPTNVVKFSAYSGDPSSTMVLNLLHWNESSPVVKKIKTSIASVDESRDNNRQKYAFNLFTSTMQATKHSVDKQKNMSIVMSGRVTMFIKLEVNDKDECIIRTSDLVMNGSSDYIARLLSFLNGGVHGCQTQATCKAPLTLSRRVTEGSDVSDRNAFEGAGGKILLSNPFASSEMDSCSIDHISIKSDHEDTSSSARNDETNAMMTLKHQVLWQHALSPYKESVVEDGVHYLGRDEDGILIPYLHQIKEEEVKVKEGPLGEGRCGEVRKIPWKNDYAAVKHFRKGDDLYDEKDQIEPIDAYKHELEVFHALKSVWGVYIPELLFHTSWTAWRPSIGMELGTGMPDDFSDPEWTTDNKKMRDEAVKAVRNLGYVQDDMRGANFIRLRKSGRIAMIDFESFVKVGQQN